MTSSPVTRIWKTKKDWPSVSCLKDVKMCSSWSTFADVFMWKLCDADSNRFPPSNILLVTTRSLRAGRLCWAVALVERRAQLVSMCGASKLDFWGGKGELSFLLQCHWTRLLFCLQSEYTRRRLRLLKKTVFFYSFGCYEECCGIMQTDVLNILKRLHESLLQTDSIALRGLFIQNGTSLHEIKVCSDTHPNPALA